MTSSIIGAKYDGEGNYLSGSILQYCTLKNIYKENYDNFDSGFSYIDHCELKDGRISMRTNTTVVISNTKISGDTRWADSKVIREAIDIMSKKNIQNTIQKIVLKNNVLNCSKGIMIWGTGYATLNVSLQNNTLISNGGMGRGIEIERAQNVTLQGNTLTGYGDAHSYPYLGETRWSTQAGGGIYLSQCKKVTLLKNVVRKCTRGGGVYITYTANDVIVKGNTITENKGGGLHISSDNADISIKNNTISCNTWEEGEGGGGVWASGKDVVIEDNAIIGNSAGTNGVGGVDIDGKAVVIEDNIIIENSAGRYGGISVKSAENSIISNNIITRNRGGGLYCELAEVTNNTIIDNDISRPASWGVGSAIAYYGNKKIRGNIISNNKGKLSNYLKQKLKPRIQNDQKTTVIYIKGDPIFTQNVIMDNTTDITIYFHDFYRAKKFNAKNNYWGTGEKVEVLKTHNYLRIDAVPFLTENPVPVGSLTIDMEPKALSADGISTATITVTLKDSNNNPVSDEDLKMFLLAEKWSRLVADSDTTGVLSEVQNKGDGTYTTTYTASQEIGQKTIWIAAPQNRLVKSFDVTLLEPVTYQSRLLKIPPVKARAGKRVVASVTIDIPSYIDKIDINLDYNPKLLAVQKVAKTKLTEDTSLTTNTESDGKLNFSLSNSKRIANSSGSLVNIVFQVKENAPHGETPLKFTNIALYDESGRPIPFSHTNGSILIKGELSLWIFVGISAVVIVVLIIFVVIWSKRKPRKVVQP